MSYMVMECHPGYAILLDEEGRFFKAANLHYEVGQTVYDPVLMREGAAPRRRHPARWVWRAVAAAAACCLILLGVGRYQSYHTPCTAIYLTINPEIRMDLNRSGVVVDAEGLNGDGQTLLEGYDWGGKDSVTVTGELVERAIALGFLTEGGVVSCAIDAPDQETFRTCGMALRQALDDRLDGRLAVRVEIVEGREPAGQGTEGTPPQGEKTPVPMPTVAPTPTATSMPAVTPTPAAVPSAVQTPGYQAGDYGSTTTPPANPPVAGSDYGSGYGSGYGSAYGSGYSDYGWDGSDYRDGSTDYDPDH